MNQPVSAPAAARRPRSSLFWKLFALFVLCMVLLLGANWLLNTFVLESYYTSQKEKAVAQSFSSIDALFTDDSAARLQQVGNRLESLANNDGISTTIWADTYILDCRARGSLAADWSPQPPMGNYLSGHYQIREEIDERLGTAFITLNGRLSNGYTIQMRTPIASIQESVDITNRFLLISGASTLVIALILVFFAARSFIRPIQELSRVAGSVARLDFRDRYTRGGSDEIADLGASINSMSASLERTISDLQTANRQLQDDVRQKTVQNEARRAFIANVSHELKTPIALISNYAEGLREDIADGAVNRDYYCEVIEDEAKKMSALIQKMTMLMQLEAGSEQLDIEPCDIQELLVNLMEKNRIRFAQKQVTLRLPDSGPVYVLADDYLMENVLTNYLSNALNHVEEGGEVEGRIIRTADGPIRITIFNTGTPIPEEDLPRIWESFYKVDKARTRAYGGTGIGLSVVAAIMNAHHMPYGVRNRYDPGRTGVEFFIELQPASPAASLPSSEA